MPASSKPQSQAQRRTSIGARRNPESEAAVLAAARALLRESGYAGFSIEEVARRAGAGKRTIYRWWPSKAELFMAVYRADKDAAMVSPDTGDVVQDLTEYTLSLWRFWRESPSGGAFRALISEAQADPDALVALRDKFLPERLLLVRDLFSRAAASGVFPPDSVELRVQLWLGFNWFRLLTDQVQDDPERVGQTMRVIAGR